MPTPRHKVVEACLKTTRELTDKMAQKKAQFADSRNDGQKTCKSQQYSLWGQLDGTVDRAPTGVRRISVQILPQALDIYELTDPGQST